MTTSKNHENYWKVDFQIDILEEACETASHIVNCHRTACMPAHAHKCMHMRFAWWAMLGSLFPNMACPNSDTWRVRIQIFFFFFFFFFLFFFFSCACRRWVFWSCAWRARHAHSTLARRVRPGVRLQSNVTFSTCMSARKSLKFVILCTNSNANWDFISNSYNCDYFYF